MNPERLHFLLVPDSGAARRLRRVIATEAARSGVVVGVWQELVQWVRDAQVLPEPISDWDACLQAAMAGIDDAFWRASYRQAPTETAAAVSRTYTALLEATGPDFAMADYGKLGVTARNASKLADLVRLHEALAGALPPALAAAREIIDDPLGDASLRRFVVYHREDFPRLSAWQQQLVDHLNVRSAAAKEPDLHAALTSIANASAPQKPGAGALGTLREQLYRLPKKPYPIDASLQWLGVRDYYEEAEVAAGMVQQLLHEDSERSLARIGLLLPDSTDYEQAVRDAFSLAGIPLSGMPDSRGERDLGRELLDHFLTSRQKPAPAMALASCLASPLMPWTAAEGAAAAQRAIDGDWQLPDWHGLSGAGRRALALLRGASDSPAALSADLKMLCGLLSTEETVALHRRRFEEAASGLSVMLAKADRIDWAILQRQFPSERLPTEPDTVFSLEGLTVWREGVEPWRSVDQLIVLGFSSGHYPRSPGQSPVFAAQDWDEIAEASGLDLDTRRKQLGRARRQFRRQLENVSEGITFFISRRDAKGAPLTASESLAFMLHLFGLDEDHVLNLDLASDRALARHLALCPDEPPVYCPPVADADLALDTDLLHIRRDAEGNPKPESPSGLETLIVSPLGRLLQRLHAEPTLWVPEEANVLLLGTLAHSVFEHVFPAGAEIPQRADLPDQVRSALDVAIAGEAPFMRSALWRVDRRQLESELVQAAETWRDVLLALEARVIGNEVWLQGDLDGLSIHGQADALLELPNDRLLIVDFKKSSAGGRRTRMKKRYDSQVELYRQMINTGGIKEGEQAELGARLQAAGAIGVVYFTLNDQTSLSDMSVPGAAGVPGWETLNDDVATEAMALINERVSQLRDGHIRLNRVAEMDSFEKDTGIKPYALEISPLVTLFMLAGEGDEP